MATIAELAVSLTARTLGFDKNMKRAEKRVRQFAGDLKRHTKTIAGFGLAMGGAAVAGISALVKRQLGLIDNTAKLARTFGLASESLIGLNHLAELSGVSTETFNQTLVALTKRVGEAKQNTGPLITFLKKYDSTLLENIKNSGNGEQAIRLVADAIQGAANEFDAAAIANAAFSRTGVRNVELFRKMGSGAIDQAIAKTKALGTSFNEIDAKKAEDANDAIFVMGQRISGVSNLLAINLAPLITGIAEKLTAMSMEGGSMGDVVSNAVDMILTRAAKLADWFELLKAGWFAFQAGVTGSAAILIKPFQLMVNAIQHVLDLVEKVTGIKIDVAGLTNGISDSLTDATFDAARKSSDAFNKFLGSKNSQAVKEFIDDARKRGEAAAESVSKIKLNQDLLGTTAKTPGEFLNADVTKLAIGGIQSNKVKNSVSDDKSHELLSIIAKNTGKSSNIAVAA